MKQKLFILSLVFSVAFGACSKNSSSNTVTKVQLLTKSDWIMISLQHTTSSSSTPVDDFSSFPACQKDDHYVFRTDYSYEANEGTLQCGTAQILDTGTWGLSSDETTLILNSGAGLRNIPIITLGDNSFVISYTQVQSGVTYYYTQGFSH